MIDSKKIHKKTDLPAMKVSKMIRFIFVCGIILIMLASCAGKPIISNESTGDESGTLSYLESGINETISSNSENVFGSTQNSNQEISSITSENTNTNGTISGTGTIIKPNSDPLGSFLLLTPIHGSLLSSVQLTVKWKESKNAETYTVLLEQLRDSGSTYVRLSEKTGLTGTSYTFPINLSSNATFRWNVYAVNSGGKLAGMGGNNKDGNVIMTPIDVKNHPANTGLNFSFDGSVSKEVLCNYLSRSMVVSGGATSTGDKTGEILRMIYNSGAKYIGRAGCYWNPGIADERQFSKVQETITKAHAVDPDIVFESSFFECVSDSVNEISIPSWVFTAFGNPTEVRNFNYEKMIFPDGTFKNQWGTGASVPDIRQLETQMFMYYRVCRYIDLGYEALHLGQVHLIGAKDTNYTNYTKVLTLIRSYAKIHARRHFIFINAHTHGIIDANGKLMCDFHAWPIRGALPDGSVSHVATETNPQIVNLKVGYGDAIFKDSLGGTTYSGWSCNSLPYFVELDNYASEFPDRNKIVSWWGYDEISWFANQPKSYRATWLSYAYNWVNATDSTGYLEMPGMRVATVYNNDSIVSKEYFAASKLFSASGYDDEYAIRSVWVANRQK